MPVFLLAGIALLLGFFLILLSALFDRKKTTPSSSLEEPLISLEVLQTVCLALVDEMKLQMIEAEKKENGIDLLAENPAPIIGGKYLFRGILLKKGETVPLPQIVEFSDTVTQERISKGVLVTTGQLPPEVSRLTELAPMELIDGERLKQLMEKYQIPFALTR